jgi:hypothetical protein
MTETDNALQLVLVKLLTVFKEVYDTPCLKTANKHCKKCDHYSYIEGFNYAINNVKELIREFQQI